ncbi:MAG: hypothetical protein IKJ27_00175 [Clostridia bacterium]|nr:hypothetical protein [Clostridia bacterium]
MAEQYIFGAENMPEWVSGRLYHYRREDSSTGYEIDTGRYMKVIFFGDKLIRNGDFIKVERGDGRGENKTVDG